MLRFNIFMTKMYLYLFGVSGMAAAVYMMVASTFVESYPKGLQVFAFALTMGVIGA